MQELESITAAELAEMEFPERVDYHELYVIGAYMDSKLVAVKIGISRDCGQRLKYLQRNTFAELEIMYFCSHESVKIAREFEKIAHNELQRHRIQGEWFRPTEEVLGYFPLFPTQCELIRMLFPQKEPVLC